MTSLTITKKRGRYHAIYRDGDRKKWRSLGTTDKRAAEAKASVWRREFFAGEYNPWRAGASARGAEELVREFLDQKAAAPTGRTGRLPKASTMATYTDILMLFAGVRADSWEERARKFLSRPGLSPATVKNNVAHLRPFLSWLVSEGILDAMPDLPAPKAVSQRRPLTLEQAKEIAAVDDEIGPAVLFAFYTGLRISELVGMRWEDVDDGGLYLHDTKAGEPQYVVVPQVARKLLAGIGRGAYGGVWPFSRDALQRRFRKAADSIGLTWATFHCLRHGFCTHLAVNHKSAFTIMAAARHKDISTAAGYVKIGRASVREALAEVF